MSLLAGELETRGELTDAIAVIRPFADAGGHRANEVLAELFLAQGRLDDLRRPADDDPYGAGPARGSPPARRP